MEAHGAIQPDESGLKKLLDAAARLPPEQRPAFLDAACNGNAPLRREVESLLEALDRAAGLLSSPTFDDPENVAPGPAQPDHIDQPDQPGTIIKHYKLLEQIGEGGMGSVFMAEQLRPVRRKVALKIIKPGLDTKQVIARFEAERQALAMMDHPSIAKVFDAGVTEAGRSYFVMELVKGIPLTEYCDQRQLTPRQRLELFVQVCSAVQHAHTKGVIHRDLKPTNVLVTLNDDKPIPKIIDFGIAKATAGQRLTERTLFTHFREFIGTPLYMSPEQAEMSSVMDVDTRSDVYSLGVLLYELLTGTTPFDKERLARAAYEEVRRIIREEEPPRPSTRLSTLGATLGAVSAQRQPDVQKLGQIVRGDLDWIVMKALEKDRTRRYETANGLARDVERYLNDQPVEACPPSRTYRLRKFARRNKAALVTGTVIAAVLVAATVVSMWQAIRATRAERQIARERDQVTLEKQRADDQAAIAKAVNDFVNKDLLAQASVFNQIAPADKPPAETGDEEATAASTPPQLRTPDSDLKVRDALDRAAERISGRFEKQPLVEASIRLTIGDAYSELGEYDRAEQQAKAALEIRRRILGDTNPDTLEAGAILGDIYGGQTRFAQAEPLLLEALRGQRAALGEADQKTLRTMQSLGQLYRLWERSDKAAELLGNAFEVARNTVGPRDPLTLSIQLSLGTLYANQNRIAEAEQVLSEGLNTARDALGEMHPTTLSLMNNLGVLYHNQKKRDKAEPLYLKCLEWARKVHGPLSANHTLITVGNLGRSYHDRSRDDLCDALFRETLDSIRAAKGDNSAEALGWTARMGAMYMYQLVKGRPRLDQAEPLLVRALEGQRKLLGSQDPRTIDTMLNLGMVYNWQRRGELAQPLLREGVLLRRQRVEGDGPDAGRALAALASDAEWSFSQPAMAEQFYREALAMYRKASVSNDDVAAAMVALATLVRKSDRAYAKDLVQDAIVIARNSGASLVLANALHQRGHQMRNDGNPEDAEKLYQEALAIRRRLNSDAVVDSLNALANLLRTQGRHVEAEVMLREVLESYQRSYPAGHYLIARAKSRLGASLVAQRKHDQAQSLLLEAYAEMLSQPPPKAEPEQPTVIARRIAQLYAQWSKPEEAAKWRAKLRLTPEQITEKRAAIDETNLKAAQAIFALGEEALLDAGELPQNQKAAEQLYREAIAMLRALPEPEPNQQTLLNAFYSLARDLRYQGRFDEAKAVCKEAMDVARNANNQAGLASAINQLGNAMKDAGDLAEAEKLYREAIEMRRGLPGQPVAITLASLAQVLRSQGRYAEAEPLLREQLELNRKFMPEDPRITGAQSVLGDTVRALGKYDEAETLLLVAYGQQTEIPPLFNNPERPSVTIERIIKLYEEWGKPDQAAKWRANQTTTRPSTVPTTRDLAG